MTTTIKKMDETLLETLDKTKWVFDGIGFPAIYLRFNDSNTDYLELWAALADDECYIYGNSSDDNSLTIVENSKSKLVIKATESSDYYSIITITIVGEKLNFKQDYYVEGNLDDTDVLIFNKTSANLNDLDICDFGFKLEMFKKMESNTSNF